MISKNDIHFIRSLSRKQIREENQCFIAEGEKTLNDILYSDWEPERILATEKWLAQYEGICQKRGVTAELINEKELGRISQLTSPNQVLAIVKMKETKALPETLEGLNLILDGISDPGNMGTIIRTADWFGVKHVICSENCADIYNPKVIQASMGSFLRTRVHYTDIVSFIRNNAKTTPFYETTTQGESVFTTALNPNACIVIGSESHGISQEVSRQITHKISIPSYSQQTALQSSVESLNAGVATAIFLAEFRRQTCIEEREQ